jgi:hypothetical protein
MTLFRLIFGLLLVASIVCFAVYIVTREPVWRRRGTIVLKWTVLAAAGFFAVLILERLPMLL